MTETQYLLQVIAVLTKRLGGEVEIKHSEIMDPPEGEVTRDDDGNIKIVVKD